MPLAGKHGLATISHRLRLKRRLVAEERQPKRTEFWILAGIIAAMVVFRVVIVRGLPFSAATYAAYDDGLFMRLAAELCDGHWLGEYTVTTLIKGPGYPMFIAMAHLVRVPLPIAEQLLYSWACILVVWALYPAVKQRWILPVFFVLMMLNPFSWGPLPVRFTRDTISAHLALWLLAAAIGIVVRRRQSAGVLVCWGVLAGLAGAWSWLYAGDRADA
jgi:hypothetical protein